METEVRALPEGKDDTEREQGKFKNPYSIEQQTKGDTLKKKECPFCALFFRK